MGIRVVAGRVKAGPQVGQITAGIELLAGPAEGVAAAVPLRWVPQASHSLVPRTDPVSASCSAILRMSALARRTDAALLLGHRDAVLTALGVTDMCRGYGDDR